MILNGKTGVDAPEVTVEEPEESIPNGGWSFVKTETSLKDNKLVDGGTLVADVTNEWNPVEEIILTMKLGGKVWDDTNRTIDKHVDSKENGIIDEGEPGISNVKVMIYRAFVNKTTGNVEFRSNDVYAYDENNLTTRVDNSTYTDENGNWRFGAVSVPAFVNNEKDLYGNSYVVTYDVEFEYDGQTYEPTEFLASARTGEYDDSTDMYMYSDITNKWNKYKNSTTSEKDNYLYNSMVIDNINTRETFNNSFANIKGKLPIDEDGRTVGTTSSGKELNYTSVDSVSFFNSDNSRKVSTLTTLDEDGYIKDEFKILSSTSNANLTFPFYTVDPRFDISAWNEDTKNKTITDAYKITYKFEAIYNYCLSINLGLVEREAADIAVEKDLTEALVVVNGKALKYKFSSAVDLEDPNFSKVLYKQLAVADSQIGYKLGLYKGDYYYRASVYDGTDTGNALKGFYDKTLKLPLESTEMEVYLKYNINVYNQSETYDVIIGEIADYHDSSLSLITSQEYRYVQSLDGKDVNNVIEVAKPSTLSVNGNTENVDWKYNKSYSGSDGVNYNKIVTNVLNNKKLSTGERAIITVTFKIEKDKINDSGIKDAIKLGQKHNVAEVTEFTSYYSEISDNKWSKSGDISGRVDENSAPDNVNIVEFNEKSYYEDDTDSAPIITVELLEEQRTISGMVWDDAQTTDVGYGQKVGNGYYKADEDKIIKDLTTEIYESISIPKTYDNGEFVKDGNGDIIYEEYQFAWPTDTKYVELGNHSINDLTGFSQAVVTDDNGEYSFNNIPAGNYKVRFVYGDKLIGTENKDSQEVYNGQDYKTTSYQIGFNNDRDNDGYVDNEWHDITNSELSKSRVNDARDNEARRLYISAKSEMLSFDNTTLLSTADDIDANHDKLFGNYHQFKNNPVTGDGYYMYAETAKINLGIENIYNVKYTTEDINGVEVSTVDGNVNQANKDNTRFVYNIENVDCGLEERSKTKMTIDEQIKEVKLITSDTNVILDAIYDISYTLNPDGKIISSVKLNKSESKGFDDHIKSLNRNNYNQGYRYIAAQGDIFQGAMIEVKYQISVFNMSETDRISKKLEDLWNDLNKSNSNNILKEELNKISTNLYTENKGRVYLDNNEYIGIGYGSLFGSVYYLGSQASDKDVIAKTKIYQMINYIDPDIEFSNTNNLSKDQSWSNTEIEYLLDNHLIDPSIVQILDKDGRVTGETYATRQTLEKDERFSIISDKLQEYKSESKNNLVLAINNNVDQDTGSNPDFMKYLEPYMANNDTDKSVGTISLTVSRTYTSEFDPADIDNLVEILQFENTAGRRDSRNISGNANPYKLDNNGEPVGIYAVTQGKEKDASATEVITLSAPTGLDANESMFMQFAIVVIISMSIIAVSIILIKKKVLIKK